MVASLASTSLAAAPRPREAAARIPEIDWLRGVAAFAVFGFHVASEAHIPPRALPPFTLAGHTFANLPSPFSFGASGVNLFFVLSGFCLALQQIRAGRGALRGRPLRQYFQGRFARIVPAYWVAVVISAAFVLWLGAIPTRRVLEDTALHLGFLQGVERTRFLAVNPALWSMATEVQFYLLFPLCLGLLTRLGTRWFVVTTGLFDLAYRVVVAYYPFVDGPGPGVTTSALLAYQLPGRLWEFALGMALAELYLHGTPSARRWFSWLWAPSLVLAVGCRVAGPGYLPDLALGLFYTSLCGLVLIARRGVEPGPVMRFMNSWGARFGRASYSFFLLHSAILLFGVKKVLPWGADHPYRCFALLFCAGLPVSVGAAVALYLGVELPLWKKLRP